MTAPAVLLDRRAATPHRAYARVLRRTRGRVVVAWGTAEAAFDARTGAHLRGAAAWLELDVAAGAAMAAAERGATR